MSESKKQKMPHFKPQIPAAVLKAAAIDKVQEHILNELSISKQTQNWIAERLTDGEEDFDAIKAALKAHGERLNVMEQFKSMLVSKWSLVALVFGSLLVPVAIGVVVAQIVKSLK